MRRSHMTRAAKGALLAACVLGAATALPAAPAWARGRGHRPFPPGGSPTVTSTTVPSTLPLPNPPSPAPADSCAKGSWPASVAGRPTSFQPGVDGAYLWYDPDGGWALRVTNAGLRRRVIFSGSLTSARGTFLDVHSVGDQGNDIVVVSPNHHTVLFRFVNFGQVGGLDFATRCASAFRVEFHISGQLAPPSDVYLGAQGSNPATNPFRVERLADDTNADLMPGGAGAPTTTTTTGASARSTVLATATTKPGAATSASLS